MQGPCPTSWDVIPLSWLCLERSRDVIMALRLAHQGSAPVAEET